MVYAKAMDLVVLELRSEDLIFGKDESLTLDRIVEPLADVDGAAGPPENA